MYIVSIAYAYGSGRFMHSMFTTLKAAKVAKAKLESDGWKDVAIVKRG